MFVVIVIVCTLAYEPWKTWRRTTAWGRVPKRDDARE